MFSKESLDKLKQSVETRLSEKRYRHTLGVADMAVRLGDFFMPDCKDELYAAALLHDIAKELNKEELSLLLEGRSDYLSADDLASPAVIHSLAGPLIIARDYSEFATDRILRAVYNHTLGSEDMDIFSEIIFISDFIEMGRTYKACIELREFLLSGLSHTQDLSINRERLRRAVFKSLDFTVRYITEREGFVHPKTVLARNAYRSLI